MQPTRTSIFVQWEGREEDVEESEMEYRRVGF